MVTKIIVKQVVKYGGHSVNRAGVVNVTFVAEYSELINTINTFQTLGEDVEIMCKCVNEKPRKLGTFKVKSITTNGDGQSKIKFEGMRDSVEMDNLNRLPLMQEEASAFNVRYESEVDEDA